METSVVGYLTGRLARKESTSEKQLATREWWQDARNHFDLEVSEFVMREVCAGDPMAARDRLAALASLTILQTTKVIEELGHDLVQSHAMSPKALQDAMHVATAVVYGVDYLATWNLRHIKNPRTISLIEKWCRNRGYAPVKIRTPKELRRISMQETEHDPIIDDDPIMAELRQIRAEMMAKVGNDPRKLMDYVRSERQSPTTDCCGNPLVGLDEWMSRKRSKS